MKNKELRNALLTSLASDLSVNGYLLNKGLEAFTKKLPDGWNRFSLTFLDYDGWEVKPSMLIRKNLVEDIYHRTSFFEPKYHNTTPTIGISVENLLNNGSDYRFLLTEEKDIEPCRQWVLKTFFDIAEPFFTKYNSLEELDKAVNVLQGKSIFSGPKFEGNVGIILAKLVGNIHYNEFVEKYRKYYEWFSNGYYMPEYEGVLKTLSLLEGRL